MMNCIYLASQEQTAFALPLAQTGFGFSAEGGFRAPGILADVLVLDDRFPPSRQGMAEARAFFAAADYGRLICDFEQPFDRSLAELVSSLDPARLVLPPQYREIAHAALFPPPYRAGQPYAAWLRRWEDPLVLDHMPLCLRADPGAAPQPVSFEELPPLRAFVSTALCCAYRVDVQGFYLYDTVQTYSERASQSGCPCVVPVQEYAALLRHGQTPGVKLAQSSASASQKNGVVSGCEMPKQASIP